MDEITRTAEQVDILLLLEGTYPYVQGGVSSWLAQLIAAYPQYEFGAIFLGSHPRDYAEMRYKLPPNLKHFEKHYLFYGHDAPAVHPRKGNKTGFACIEGMHEWFRAPNSCPYEPRLGDINFYLDPKKGVDYSQFLYSQESWAYITKTYEERCTDPSFINYFWAIRNMHAPLWVLAKIAHAAPKAKVYHTACTGYAGFLGGLLHHHTGRPLILSEHGIYTKERKIDLLQINLNQLETSSLIEPSFDLAYIQQIWIKFFSALGLFCYEASDPIVSLFQSARKRQLLDGAKEERTQVIANGVDVERFKQARQTVNTPPKVIVLVGRIVPIKDIKTFIRAMRIISNQAPDWVSWLVGPMDEDKPYVEECKNLVNSLNLQEQVKFLGPQNTVDILAKTGILVLSSISEGLPLVLLEAFAAGVPAVATNVGSCKQLLLGDGEEDEALGPSGRIVSIANPRALADAILALAEPEQWRQARASAIARVERYYTQETMFARYQQIYTEALKTWQE